jgi:alanine racemase
LTLDLESLRRNVSCWRAVLGAREVWAVVKSDAYGLGAVEVARACIDGGAERLVVLDVAEARPLRASGITAPIVQVFATPSADMGAAVHFGVIPSVEDEAGARALSAVANWRGRRMLGHVAVDTGTGLTGVPVVRAAELARVLATIPGVAWEGAWTHIAGRETLDVQMRSFATAVAALRAEGVGVPVLHAASTGPALWGVSSGAARIGVGLYGSTLGDAGACPGLRTCVEMRADVVAVKRFERAVPLGYGGRAHADAGETIATLRAGYADGLPRALADDGGAAIIKGERCAVAGAIGMNFTMVRVPLGVRVEVGDEALLLGDADGVRIDEVAQAAGTIPHALMTSLAAGMRVRRIGATP